jgi:hypothetical protein
MSTVLGPESARILVFREGARGTLESERNFCPHRRRDGKGLLGRGRLFKVWLAQCEYLEATRASQPVPTNHTDAGC